MPHLPDCSHIAGSKQGVVGLESPTQHGIADIHGWVNWLGLECIHFGLGADAVAKLQGLNLIVLTSLQGDGCLAGNENHVCLLWKQKTYQMAWAYLFFWLPSLVRGAMSWSSMHASVAPWVLVMLHTASAMVMSVFDKAEPFCSHRQMTSRSDCTSQGIWSIKDPASPAGEWYLKTKLLPIWSWLIL